jgi:hypothetical protein
VVVVACGVVAASTVVACGVVAASTVVVVVVGVGVVVVVVVVVESFVRQDVRSAWSAVMFWSVWSVVTLRSVVMNKQRNRTNQRKPLSLH